MNQKLALSTLLFLGYFIGVAQDYDYSINPPADHANNIRSYLCGIASDLTNSSLLEISDLGEWKMQEHRRRTELMEMLGLQDKPVIGQRDGLKIIRTGVIQEEGFRIEKLFYESLPNLLVPANLYIPDGVENPVPAILYVCGHAPMQKQHYQAHARTFAQNGFVCLLIETIQRGEVRGEHLGAESLGWFHWYSRGYNPGGVEVWNGIRGIDLLCNLPEVDTARIGVTGISGGGSQSWYLPALDRRVKAVAAVAGAASLEGQVCQRTVDDHCDCMMPINTYGIDFSDIGALIAPRPFMIAQTTGDGYYSIESVRTLLQKVKNIYTLYGETQNIKMVEAAGGHSYGEKEEFRSQILVFFMKELMGTDVTTDEVGQIDIAEKLTEDELRVYVGGVPPDDITKTIQDLFVELADPPEITSPEQFNDYHKKVKDFLIRKTFRAFPREKIPLGVRLEFRDSDFAKYGRQIFSFVSEEGWRLKFSLFRRQPVEKPSPLLVVLVSPDGDRWAPYSLTSGIDEKMNIVFFEARGIGETGWSPGLQWHIRRAAAWTGRTIGSMRVYDVLRALEALRMIPGVDSNNIYLAGEGEMAAIASYAALMDGHIKTLILKDPPATQNIASRPDGQGETTEMLNCLRVTDLAQVTGLMYPNQIVTIGPMPQTYRWVEDLYRQLNKPDGYKNVQKLSEWKAD